MRARWHRLVESLLPARVTGDDAILARYFVTAWAVTFPFSLVSIVLYAVTGVWGQVILSAQMMLIGVVMVSYFKRTGRFEVAARISLLAAAFNFGLATLVQIPPDPFNVAFLTIVPLLASLCFGPRRALGWVAGIAGWGLAMLWLALHGYALPYPDPSPFTSSGMNFVFMLLLTWVFVRTYANLEGRAVERSQEADKAKSAFLAAISHEIRTPMNGVIGMTELLLQGDVTAAQREQLEVLQRSGQVLVSLINDLLDFSKAEAGKLAVESEAFDLKAVLGDVEALFAAEARKKQLRLSLTLGEGLPTWVRGDGFRLRQVLSNLVSNALKFTDAGQVTLRAAPAAEGRVAFSVEDTGTGMTPEVQAQLFTRFHQGEPASRRRLGGTGLGLALSQQLVGLMGGHIAVESTPGRGTRFHFELPLPVTLPALPPSPVPAVSLGRVRRALVVDDNAINLAVAAGLMQRAGFVVDRAASGKDALELAARNEYALVLMDLQMPEMDGFAAAARLRELPGRHGSAAVVAVTAAALPEDLAACRAAGMQDVLVKPLTWKSLQALLESLSLESGEYSVAALAEAARRSPTA